MGTEDILKFLDSASKYKLMVEMGLQIAKASNDPLAIKLMEFRLKNNDQEIEFLQQLLLEIKN